jgi:hypothetical protein
MKRSIGFVMMVAVCAGSAWATGPAQQLVPWRPAAAGQFSTLNSVVQMQTNTSLGTGTIIGKNIDAGTGDAWVCVLTANHVVRGANNIRIGLGDNNAEGLFGGADSRQFQRGTDDMSIVGVRLGKVQGAGANAALLAKFNALTPASMIPTTNLQSYIGRQFSQVGYGGTGDFVAGGMDARVNDAGPLANPRYSLNIDNNKRFQNNQISSIEGVAGGGYFYDSVRFTFDPAAANGLLAGEGLSYAGDSGSPYFRSVPSTQAVAAFNRPGQLNWAGGNMDILTDAITAVHTRGGSRPSGAGSNTFFTPYSAGAAGEFGWGAGLPLTPARVGWIQQWCVYVPTPGIAGTAMVFGLAAMRRRR